jgi:hypothetical protein
MQFRPAHARKVVASPDDSRPYSLSSFLQSGLGYRLDFRTGKPLDQGHLRNRVPVPC